MTRQWKQFKRWRAKDESPFACPRQGADPHTSVERCARARARVCIGVRLLLSKLTLIQVRVSDKCSLWMKIEQLSTFLHSYTAFSIKCLSDCIFFLAHSLKSTLLA